MSVVDCVWVGGAVVRGVGVRGVGCGGGGGQLQLLFFDSYSGNTFSITPSCHTSLYDLRESVSVLNSGKMGCIVTLNRTLMDT